MRKQGFTLIELLVVIAIIAILAAILFPVFANAKERARQVKCLNNLKQLTAAIRQYCDDNNGVMPCVLGYNLSPEVADWAGCLHNPSRCDVRSGQLWPYVRNTEAYVCPTDFRVPAKDIPGAPTDYQLSYSMNANIGSFYDVPSKNNRGHLSLSRLDAETAGRASKVLMLIHEKRDRINDGFYNWGNGWDIPSEVHYDGTTVSYADGHCKWASCRQLLDEMSSFQWQNNTNRDVRF